MLSISMELLGKNFEGPVLSVMGEKDQEIG